MSEPAFTHGDNFREYYGWVTGADPAAPGATTPAPAEAAAVARRIERSQKRVDIAMPGTNAIIAGAILNLVDFRPQLSGRYKILVVRHSLSRDGWITTLTCEGAA